MRCKCAFKKLTEAKIQFLFIHFISFPTINNISILSVTFFNLNFQNQSRMQMQIQQVINLIEGWIRKIVHVQSVISFAWNTHKLSGLLYNIELY